MHTKPPTTGFTAIEILLVVGLFSLLAALTIPTVRTLQAQTDLDSATATAAHALRRAQLLSQAVDGDANWGTVFTQSAVTVFRGNSYAAREPAYDEIFPFSEAITPTGLSEIVFEKFSGIPKQIGTLILTAPTNDTRTITLNALGVVEY